MAVQLRAGDVIRQIVERTDLDDFTERVLDSFWQRPEYQRFRPLREDVRAWVRWNIDLVIRWLVDGRPPSEADLERFRERARMLAENGMPADIVPANFRRGARYAWTALLDGARDDERAALVDSAELLFDFVDRVSELFSDTYEATGPPADISEGERRARALLARAGAGDEPSGEDLQLAERIGFELSGAYRPFVVVAPAWSVQRHLAFAGRLRSRHLLAVAEGRRVAGLAHRAVPWGELGVDPRAAEPAGGSCPTRSTSCARSSTWRCARAGRARSTWTTTSPSCCCAARRGSPGACTRAYTTGSQPTTPSSRAPSTR
jgi:hypothetical protein